MQRDIMASCVYLQFSEALSYENFGTLASWQLWILSFWTLDGTSFIQHIFPGMLQYIMLFTCLLLESIYNHEKCNMLDESNATDEDQFPICVIILYICNKITSIHILLINSIFINTSEFKLSSFKSSCLDFSFQAPALVFQVSIHG